MVARESMFSASALWSHLTRTEQRLLVSETMFGSRDVVVSLDKCRLRREVPVLIDMFGCRIRRRMGSPSVSSSSAFGDAVEEGLRVGRGGGL